MKYYTTNNSFPVEWCNDIRVYTSEWRNDFLEYTNCNKQKKQHYILQSTVIISQIYFPKTTLYKYQILKLCKRDYEQNTIFDI